MLTGVRAGGGARHASFTMAITMPASTKTTIATCVQIQNGDMPPAYDPAPSVRSIG
jgi:hypothetical protein